MPDLPPVTPDDIQVRPDELRKTAKGGYAWKCGKCGQYASSLTASGPRCYQHGGTRKSAKDPKAVVKAVQDDKPLPRPPGRPLKTGWYSKDEMVNVYEIVEDYRARGLNPDATDEDILHLRARLQNLQSLEPTATQLADLLETTLEEAQTWLDDRVDDADGRTVEEVLEKLEKLQVLNAILGNLSRTYSKFKSLQDGIEARHTNLVKLSQIRADTRLKNKAAEQLDVFTLMLGRLMLVLNEALPPSDFLALQKRLERDLADIPRRALEPGTIEVQN